MMFVGRYEEYCMSGGKESRSDFELWRKQNLAGGGETLGAFCDRLRLERDPQGHKQFLEDTARKLRERYAR